MTDKKTLDQWLKDGLCGFTREQIDAQFEKVRDRTHWKNDIDTMIAPGEEDLTAAAIRWYTGPSEIVFTPEGDEVRVQATGYWSNGMEG